MKHLLTTLLVAFSAIFGVAQEFKATELWDATGNIKQIKYKTSDPLLFSKNMKFDRNGKLKNSFIVYDSTGYPQGIDLNFGPISLIASFNFENNKLISAKLDRNKPSASNLQVEYMYENGDMSHESAVIHGQDKDTQYKYEFSDYKRDERGNWISRQVNLTIDSGSEADNKTKSYTETREIKYWD